MNSQTQSWRDAAASVTFALSLTAILAATLFVIVAINPKDDNYGNLPWYYAALCVLVAPLLYRLSSWIDRSHPRAEYPG